MSVKRYLNIEFLLHLLQRMCTQQKIFILQLAEKLSFKL